MFRSYSGKHADSIIIFVLITLSLIIRIPYLYDVPRFIDEWREVRLAFHIAQGTEYPLTNVAEYIGPLHNYILAGLFHLFGPSLWIPRLYVAILSAATVSILYMTARFWMNRTTSFFIALLLAVNSMHILVTHMAWSNDTTPFFISLALFVTLKAMNRKSVIVWALVGVLWAISLQTHASALTAMVGVLLYVIKVEGKALFKTKSFFAVVSAFLIGYANMIVYNLREPFGSFHAMTERKYAVNDHFHFFEYLRNVWQMVVEWVYSLASFFPDSEGVKRWISIIVMIVLIISFMIGSYRLQRLHHGKLLMYVLITSFLIIPLMNHRFAYYVSTRYIAFLFPIGLLMIGIGFSWVIHSFKSRYHPRFMFKIAFVLIGVFAIFVLPLVQFYSYAQSYVDMGRDNSAEFWIVKEIGNIAKKEKLDSVIIDRKSKQAEAVSIMLNVKGLPASMTKRTSSSKMSQEYWENLLKEKKDAWYVLSLERYKELTNESHLQWDSGQIVRNRAGKEIYFFGKISKQ